MLLLGAPTFQSKSFRLPSAAELLSLCVTKEKVTKEKGHPAWRLPLIGQLLLRCLNSGIHALTMARNRCATAAGCES